MIGINKQDQIFDKQKIVKCNDAYVTITSKSKLQSFEYTREPNITYCNNCNNQIQTCIKLKNGKGSYLMSLILLPKLLCFCILPFLFDQCKDAIHYCPICKIEVGRKNFIFE